MTYPLADLLKDKRAVEIAIEQDEAAGLGYLAAQNALSPGVQPSSTTADIYNEAFIVNS